MGHCCGHATERCESFAFCKLSLESQIFFEQSRVVDRDCNLICKESDDRARIGSQACGRCVDGQQAFDFIFTTQWICDLEILCCQHFVVFNCQPATFL